MNITPQMDALGVLHATIDLSAPTQALLNYAAARVITDRLVQELNQPADGHRSQSAEYVAGRLLGFIQKVEWAVMPWPQAEKTPWQWLQLARDDWEVAGRKAQEGV